MAKIIVADDHFTNRQLIVYLLTHQGHVVIECSDGAEALESARAEYPDLVIADIVMPVMDGYEFVRELRSNPALCGTPVLFYTAAFRDDEAKKLAQDHGVIGLLIKPIDPRQVLELVERALQRDGQTAAPPLRNSDSAILEEQHRRLVTNKLAEQVEELEREIVRRQDAEEALRSSNEELERRVRFRTREIEEANVALRAEIAERMRVEQDREELIRDLQRTLSEVKTLNGLLPICAWCRKLRDDQGYWSQVEDYIRKHTLARTTHGICPDCLDRIKQEPGHDISHPTETEARGPATV